VPVKTLCDVSDRSLRDWVEKGERKKSSGGSEE
jgi:hypothetical protein